MTRFTITLALALLPASVLATPGALIEAARSNDVAQVAGLLSSVDIDASAQNDITALHVAAAFGYTELAQLLIDNGADLNVQGDRGNTPLHFAAQEGNLEIARLLVDAGADTHILSNVGATALTWASGYGHTRIAALLTPMPTNQPVATWKWMVTAAVLLFSVVAVRDLSRGRFEDHTVARAA